MLKKYTVYVFLIMCSLIAVVYCCTKTFNCDHIIKCIDINGPSCVSISYPVTSLYIVLILHALSTHFPFYILYAFNLQLQKYARLNIQCVLKTAPVIMVKAMNCILFDLMALISEIYWETWHY